MHAPPKADAGPGAGAAPEGGADYWIMWRRVAGGLNQPLQNDAVRPPAADAAAGARARRSSSPAANELAEMWRAAASLERLDVKHEGAAGRGAA